MSNLYIAAVMLWRLNPRGWTGDREKEDVDYVVAETAEEAANMVVKRMEDWHTGYGVRKTVIKQVDLDLPVEGHDGAYRIKIEKAG